MKWNLRALFTGEQEKMPLLDTLDLSALEFHGGCPLQQPVTVDGTVTAAGGVVLLRAQVKYRLDTQCDRCLAPVSREQVFSVEHVLVTSAEDEDNDALIILDDYCLNMDELIGDDLWLELPSKFLCRKDCRGLCPQCGKNLNEGLCGCSTKTADPRLAALSRLIEQS